jgi:peptidoglycan/xylan/chitin deacetylase (PgdA/CDA1 family)
MRGFARGLFGSFLIVAGTGVSAPAFAAACNGRTDALGVSRVIAVDPREHTRVGTMQYSETLPLADHEVVITFDDGPLPRYTNRILDELNAECVKATFFMVGAMAKAYPAEVRRVYAEGHTIGTHSFHHPFTFHKMDEEKAGAEIDEGVAAVVAALGNPSDVAPFFRVPGLLTSKSTEAALASRGLMTWSADFPADDWKKISSAEIAKRALSRIEAKGRGILLLHDIHAHTADALPVILGELKKRGYKIVQVVPASPKVAKTTTTPEQWVWHHGHPPGVATAAAPASSPAKADPTDLAHMDAKPAVLQQIPGTQTATAPAKPEPAKPAMASAQDKPQAADKPQDVATPVTQPQQTAPAPAGASPDAKAAAAGISAEDAAELAALSGAAAQPTAKPESAEPGATPKSAATPKLAAKPEPTPNTENPAKHTPAAKSERRQPKTSHKHVEERHQKVLRRKNRTASVAAPLAITPDPTTVQPSAPAPTKASYNGLIGTIEHELFGD